MREARLDLLRRLTAAAPHWALVKNDASALDGSGDVDSAAPDSEWPALAAAVSDWAQATGRGPVLTCRHVEGTLVIVAVERGTPAALVQVDILDHRLLHGTPLVSAAALTADATVVPDGYRRAAPWAEGVARLVLDEWSIRGRPDTAIAALLHAVPESVDPRLAAVAAAVERGSWPRGKIASLELRTLVAAFGRPVATVRRVAAAPARRRCPILRALRAGRRVPGDLDAWLVEVGRTHSYR
jgi:hypothetical protein